jgi:hypothetical protein
VYTSTIDEFVTGDDNATTSLTVSSSDPVAAEGTKNFTFHFDSSNAIPTGIKAYTVVCHDVPVGDPDNYVIFDGDCDSGNGIPSDQTINTFFVAPKQTPNLTWRIE